jgi:hypothetical protein
MVVFREIAGPLSVVWCGFRKGMLIMLLFEQDDALRNASWQSMPDGSGLVERQKGKRG